jgi:phage protein U
MTTLKDTILRKNVFMAKFGDVVFSANGLSFEGITRSLRPRLKTFEVLTGKNLVQQEGTGEENLSISGSFFTDYHCDAQKKLEGLYKILKAGNPQLLSLTSKESAFPKGFWLIEKIEEQQSLFKSNGEPQKVSFSLDLVRVE